MNEKQTLWQKIKAFLKKYWHIAVTVAGGIAASILLYINRVPRRIINRGDELRDAIDGLGEQLDEAGSEVSDIRDDNREALCEADKQRQTIADTREEHNNITDITGEARESLERIKRLIKAERERVEKAEGKE